MNHTGDYSPTRRNLLTCSAVGLAATAAGGALAPAQASSNIGSPRVGPVGFTSFIHPTSSVKTDLFLIGAQSLIEGFMSLEGASAVLGNASDLQDNNRLLNYGRFPGNLVIGDGSFTAHGVTFIGRVQVGSACGTVINAVVQNTIIGDASLTGFTAHILGADPFNPIRILDASLVLSGARITGQSQVATPHHRDPGLILAVRVRRRFRKRPAGARLQPALAGRRPDHAILGDHRRQPQSRRGLSRRADRLRHAFGRPADAGPARHRRHPRAPGLARGSRLRHLPAALAGADPRDPGADQGGQDAPPSTSAAAGAHFIAPRVASPELTDGAVLIGGVKIGPGSYLHGGDSPAVSIGANTVIGSNSSVHELTFTSVTLGSMPNNQTPDQVVPLSLARGSGIH